MAAAVETGGLCADEAAGGQGSQDKASEHLSCSKAPISSASAQDVQALVAKVRLSDACNLGAERSVM